MKNGFIAVVFACAVVDAWLCRGLEGVLSAAVAVIVSTGPLVYVYYKNGINRNDVAFMAVVSVVAGMPATLYILLYTSIVGFCMALYALYVHHELGHFPSMLVGRYKCSSPITVPYSIALVIGSYCCFFIHGL